MPIGQQNSHSWPPPRDGSPSQLGKLLPSPSDRRYRIPPFPAWLRSAFRIGQTNVTNHANQQSPVPRKPRHRPRFPDSDARKSPYHLSQCFSLPSTTIKQMHQIASRSAPENVTIPDIRQVSSKRWTIRPEASQSPQGPLRARFQKGSPASRPPCGKLRVTARCRDHEILSYGADRFDQQACLVTASQPAPEPL